VEIKICIDVSEYDIVMLVQAARAMKMPLDSLVKKALLDYVDKALAPPQTKEGGQ